METTTKFSAPVQEWLDENGYDIDSMSLEQLKEFKNIVKEQIDKDVLLDLSVKLLGNGAYGASSNPAFYFYNLGLASDITAECRETTKYMETVFEDFFHNEWWDRKDLHERFGIEVDMSKKDWYRSKNFTVYGDTDSCHKDTLLNTEDNGKMTIEDFFNINKKLNGISYKTHKGHELVETDSRIMNWEKQLGLYYGKVKYIIRHKVLKPKWRLKLKSGKFIDVTNDHSMVVFRDGKKLVVKPAEILMTDKILNIKLDENI